MSREQRERSTWVHRRKGRKGHWVSWYIEGPDGSWLRRAVKFSNRDDALRFKAIKDAEINAHLFGVIDWTRMVTTFFAAVKSRSKNTLDEYEETLARFSAFVGFNPSAHEITSARLQDYLNDRAERRVSKGKKSAAVRLSPATVAKDARNLKRFCKFGVNQEPPWFERDPGRSLVVPSIPKHLVRKPSVDGVARLLGEIHTIDHYEVAWYALVRLKLETGLRQEDLLSLTSDNLVVHGGRLLVDTVASKTGKQGVFGMSRATRCAVMRLLPQADGIPSGSSHEDHKCDDAHEQRKLHDGVHRIFPWVVWPRKQWDKLCGAADSPSTFHDVRGAAAGVSRRMALAAQSAQSLLQHSSAVTTSTHYLDAVETAVLYGEVLDSLPLPTLGRILRATRSRSPGE